MHESIRIDHRIAIMETWGRRCDFILFIIGAENSVVNVESGKEPIVEQISHNAQLVKFDFTDKYNYLWLKTKTAFKYIVKNYNYQFDWIYKMDDDTFVIMENVKLFLQDKKSSDLVYYGCEYSALAPKGYNAGGPGYIMSFKVAELFIKALSMGKCSKSTVPEDSEIASCLHQMDVITADTRDSHGRFRFVPFRTDLFMDPTKLFAKYHWVEQFMRHKWNQVCPFFKQLWQ